MTPDSGRAMLRAGLVEIPDKVRDNSTSATSSALPKVTRGLALTDARRALAPALHGDKNLATRLIRAISGTTLNLSGFSSQAIEKIPAAAWTAIARIPSSNIENVTLPHGLTALPEGIEALGTLRSIEMHSFNGSTVLIPDALARTDIRVSAAKGHFEKITVQRQTPTGATLSTLPNHMHFQASPAVAGESAAMTQFRTVNTNLNGKAEFASPAKLQGKKIVCRHLLVEWLRDRVGAMDKDDSKAFLPARFDYEKFSSVEKIRSHIKPADQAIYERILSSASENHLVPLDCWPAFIIRQFEGMEAREARHFALSTGVHAMGLVLRRLPDDSGSDRLSIEFYDPNHTLTEQRMELRLPDRFDGLDIRKWLGSKRLKPYFGEHDAHALLVRVDASTFSPSGAETGQSARSLTLIEGRPPTAHLLQHLMNGNFAEALRTQLEQLPTDHAARVEILEARDFSGRTKGFNQACERGHADVVQVMVNAISDARNRFALSNSEIAALLESPNSHGGPALRMALTRHAPIVGILVRAILHSGLEESEKIRLLSAPYKANAFRLPSLSEPIRTAYLEPFRAATEAQFSTESRRALGSLIGAPSIPDARSGAGDNPASERDA